MISPKTQYSLKNAQEYFREHLRTGDYYSEGQTTQGAWLGIGAKQLGLNGEVGQAEFLALCENLHPTTGRTLTQQQKLGRLKAREKLEQPDPKRRVFYDFTISAPKSVSIAALIGGDQRIVEAHQKAVTVAMLELELFASTRVRIGGGSSDRETGNVVGALFNHDTSRALDPHLHTHCIVFNATFDPVENRWKALQNFEMLRAQKYVENVYYHELARSLIGLGYEITNHRRGDFDLKGLSAEVLLKFSKRHAEIDQRLATLLEENPHKQESNLADIREKIAHKERSRKIRSETPENLHLLWKAQLDPDEKAMLGALSKSPRSPKSEGESSVETVLNWAEQHVFNRRSVVPEHEIWRYALEFWRGGAFDVAELKAATKNRPYIRDKLRPNRITTQEVLGREWEIVQLAKAGACLHPSFHASFEPVNTLDLEQSNAVGRILRSGDFVTLFRGAAGTGKSFALQEVLRGLKATDHEVQVIAPQRQQVLDLNASGIGPASTVTEFLNRKAVSPGAVVILDEAGQLGAEQMGELLRLLKQSGGRLICSGDTRQHGAVESSDALRALEKYAALKSIELKTIRRQDPERAKTTKERVAIQEYRKAVQEASEGLAIESFHRLEQLGAVIECRFGEQQTVLAEQYVSLAATKESALIVAQTWSEIGKLNERIRDALKLKGLIGSSEKKVAVPPFLNSCPHGRLELRYKD